MLRDLVAFSGSQRTAAAVLEVPGLDVHRWLAGQGFSIENRHNVWLVWTLLLHPERLQTALDLMTWGGSGPAVQSTKRALPALPGLWGASFPRRPALAGFVGAVTMH